VDFFSALEPNSRVLDIGAGNGGAIFPFANAGYRTTALDVVPNPNLIAIRRSLNLDVSSVVAGGEGLPFLTGSFDLVLLLDVIEHVRDRVSLGREVMRVLRPGGRCMLTTPARFRHLFGRDPHFDVPGILFLPNALQRFVVDHVVRRRVIDSFGKAVPAYDVEHIFWSVDEITALFPGSSSIDVLFNALLNPSRFPRRAWFHYRLRRFFWDRVVIQKG
jgi:SAM-dependent methyltransferase